MRARLAGTLVLLCATLATAQDAPPAPAAEGERPLHFYGYAYDLKTGAYLYTEVHRQRIAGERWLGGTTEYYLPDGAKLGHKDLDFTQDPFVPLYRLELPLLGYMEAITAARPTLTMERRKRADAKLLVKARERPDPVCSDSGVHMFVRAHFAELMDGKRVDFSLAVPGSLDTFRFRAQRIGDTTFEDRPAVRFRVGPASLLRFLADPLEVTYDPGQRKLLEYRGMSPVRDAATGKAYDVRIAYLSKPPADVPKLPPLDCTLPDCGVPDVE